ncbi:MAG: hypothetical protein ACRC46_12225 [Thermoguttaceae bacterium]
MTKLHAVFLGMLIVAVIGCAPKANISGLVPAAGVVTLDGKPLADASITFVPTSFGSESRGAGATSDTNGKFVVATLEPDDGIFPGDYKIVVDKREVVGKAPTEADYEAAKATGRSPIVQYKTVTPTKYANAATSGLTATISPKGNKEIKLELVSQ